MNHPDETCRKNQEEFLKNCPDEDREHHAQLFRVGNAAFHYHRLADLVDDERLNFFFEEWLEGLPTNIRADMQKRGFDECKSSLPFTRYVNERVDIGMDEWMKQHLSDEDYVMYKSHSAN
jgi:hypothetical protein